jgi:ABC-type phosphate/phosphonate transport system substrate-binding protein
VSRKIALVAILTAALFPALGHAAPTSDGAGARKTSFAPNDPFKRGDVARSASAPATDDETLVFSAPPRETPEDGARLYQPVAEYLARVTGKRIEYRHPGNWLSYQTEMQKGAYDLVFDGPHFNSWRAAHLGHNTLARLAGEHAFAVVVRADNTQITDIKQLAGKKVCGMNPPNLGTLTFLGEFDNPLRQPFIASTTGWDKIYAGVVLDNKCAAGILPVANLNRLDRAGHFTKVIHRTRALPNQAFSAGPRIVRADQARIAAALAAPAAGEPTAALRAAYGSDKPLVAAAQEEYAGLDSFLKDQWGYTR